METPPSPAFHPSSTPVSPSIQNLISTLNLEPHIEGGFFIETDRAPETIPSPFPPLPTTTTDFVPQRPGSDPKLRNTSTSIFYLLTPSGPQGGFHRNAGRTVHTLHHGRGRYVIIHADEPSHRVEIFTVGRNISKGEKLQWIVPGGKYKASFLLPDEEGGKESKEGLLISETVVPGFEYSDHDFLEPKELVKLLGEQKAKDFEWLLSPLAKK